MFNQFREGQQAVYCDARKHFIDHPEKLIAIEEFLTTRIIEILEENLSDIVRDFNEASYLYPFWQNYPPDDRGRKPQFDQYPWIEVGEHAIGAKIPRLIDDYFEIRDSGLPTGPDQRLLLQSGKIHGLLGGITDASWLFLDIKSAGPRDDADHAVMSHNQVSADGIWDSTQDGIVNNTLLALGSRASHDFYASIPPLYVLSDGTIAPVITAVIKPVYSMLPSDGHGERNSGQPLSRLTIVCIPNGILLTINPNYLNKYPSLLFPGKDDKNKNHKKLRARVDFSILRKIAPWRVQSITINT